MSKMAASSALKLLKLYLLLLTLIISAPQAWSKSIDEMLQEAADTGANDIKLFDKIKDRYNHADCEVIGEHDMRMPCEQWNRLKGIKIPIKRSSFISKPRWSTTEPVHFYFDKSGSYSQEDKQVVAAAMMEIEMNSCLTFKETTESDTSVSTKLKFINGQGCWSYVGNVYKTQEISLQQNGCRHQHIAVHEILHAMGSLHEQSRTDRDQYVTIKYENLDPDFLDQFESYLTPPMLDHGIPYDYLSIMHYGDYDFSDNNKKTIVTKDAQYQDVIGEARSMSFYDIKSLNLRYNCKPADCSITDDMCSGDGFVDKNCQCVVPDTGMNAMKKRQVWKHPKSAFLMIYP